jgi:MFS family permease
VPKTPRTPRPTITLVLIAVAASFGQFGAISSLGDVAKHFGSFTEGTSLTGVVGISAGVLGLGMGLLRLASLGALPLSALGDRFGRVRVLRGSLTLGLLFTAAAAASPGYWWFVLLFACARPLLSTANTLIQVLTVEVSSDRHRVRHLAWISAGAGMGAGLSAILHSVFRGPNSFRILFALALVPAILIQPLIRKVEETHQLDRTTERVSKLGSVAQEFRRPLFILAWVAFVVGVISGPANGFAFVYGERILHIDPKFVAIVVTGSSVTGLLGLIASRWSSDSFGRRTTVGVGAIGSGLASCLAYFGGRHLFTIGYLVGVFATALWAPAASALVNETFPRRVRATVGGWIVVAGVLGATFGLFFFGVVANLVASDHSTSALRAPSLLTFLPLLPTLFVLWRLPETRHKSLD